MKPLNLNREELYALVWAKPVSRLATELGVKSWDIVESSSLMLNCFKRNKIRFGGF